MDFGKVASEIVETVGEEIKSDTKQKLSKIWRNVIIISFLLNIAFVIATVRAIGDRTDIATELLGVRQQLETAKAGSDDLERQIDELKQNLARAGTDIIKLETDIIKLESDNIKLESDNKDLKSENKGAIGNTANIESLTRDSERIVRESIELIQSIGEAEQIIEVGDTSD